MRSLLTAIVLLSVVGTVSAATPGPAASRPAVASTANEPHPEIVAAIRALERSKEHLQVAAHDFGGHRVQAMKAIDAAIAQLDVCMQYDR